VAWWLTHIGLQPHYVADYLPGMLAGGAGVGFVIPTLASAIAGSLPPARFATGSAVYGMTRQFGIALGVAVLIAVLSTADKGGALASFRNGWEVMMAAAITSALAALTIGRIRIEPARTTAVAELELVG